MSSVQGKIQWVEQPPLPAKCACCGNHWKGVPAQMIDFQVSYDDYGAVLFCESCAKELASLVSVESIESRNAQIRNLTEMNRELQEENDNIRAAFDSICTLRPDLRPDDPVSSDSDEQSSTEGTSTDE